MGEGKRHYIACWVYFGIRVQNCGHAHKRVEDACDCLENERIMGGFVRVVMDGRESSLDDDATTRFRRYYQNLMANPAISESRVANELQVGNGAQVGARTPGPRRTERAR